MLNGNSTWGLVIVLAAVCLVALLIQLSPGARLRRRLRKTHSRITSKARRPTVKFSVRRPKQRK